MPGLYGLSSNANISVYNTTGLYNVGNANVVIPGNVSVSNTMGLYQALGNPLVLNSAQALLALLFSNGNVNFSLVNSNTQVQANAIIDAGSLYSNVDVAAYLPTYTGSLSNSSDIIQLYADILAANIDIQMIEANLGAFETYANATFGTSNYGNANVAIYLPTDPTITGIQANIGAFETYANATFGTSNYGNANVQGYMQHFDANIVPSANAVYSLGSSTNWFKDLYLSNNTLYLGGVAIAIVNGNLALAGVQIPGTYSNANVIAFLPTSTVIQAINANVTAANLAIQTIDANVGAYETWANTAIQTIDANLGAFETYANLHFGDSNYSNVNVAAYIPTDPTITGIEANIGAYQIYANANAATQATSINNINANLGAFEIYANATFGTSSYGNANVAAYLPTYTGNIGASNLNATGKVTLANMNYTNSSVIIGKAATASATAAVTIGDGAGGSGTYAIAIGQSAGKGSGTTTIAIGTNTAGGTQGSYSIAIGQYAGATSISANAVVIGSYAGRFATVGGNSIVIGTGAGQYGAAGNTIILNASGRQFNGNTAGAFYVNPIRNDVGNVSLGLYYNTTTKEITYDTVASSYGNANVAAYLPTDPTFTGYLTYANANAATQTTNIDAINANLGAFETYANAVFGTSSYGNANVAAYLPTYNGNLNSVTLNQANVGNYLQFNTVPAAVSWVPGRVFWDTTANTLAYYNDNSQMTVNIGEETIIRVRNQTGAAMSNGNVVYIDGATGNTPTANLAIATSFRTADIIGMLTTDIANNGFGYATINGIVNGLDTNAIAAGTPIYVSATTPGAYTITEPIAPNYSVQVGVVIRSNPSVGSVLVSPQQISTEAQHIVGVLPISSGGTNSNAIPTAGAVTYGNGTAFAFTAVGTAGQVLSSAGTGTPTWITPYGNANVAAYLPTDPTIYGIQANVGAFETYANATFATQTALQTLDANVGAFEIYSNANIAGLYNLFYNFGQYANANASFQATSINSINANLGAFEIYANATFGTGSLSNIYSTNPITITSDSPGSSVHIYANPTSSGEFAVSSENATFFGDVSSGLFRVESRQMQIALGSLVGASNISVFNGGNYFGSNATYAGTAINIYKLANTTVPSTSIDGNGIVTAGNVAATYFIGDGSQLTNVGSYGNVQVEALLNKPTIPVQGLTLTTNGMINTTSITNVNFAAPGTPSGSLIASQGGAYIAQDLLVVGTTKTANVITTNGVFWANGDPYSSGGGTYGNTQVAAYIQNTIFNPFLLAGL